MIHATIDLNLRTAGGFRTFFNSISPTRGLTRAACFISLSAASQDLKVQVSRNSLSFEHGGRLVTVDHSGASARALYRSGAREIQIPRGASERVVEYILNSLTDNGIKGIQASHETVRVIPAITTREMSLEYAKEAFLSANEIAATIYFELPKSQPGDLGVDPTYDDEIDLPQYSSSRVLDTGRGPSDASYTDSDFQLAASIINAHEASKRPLILDELGLLNESLASSIRKYVVLS